MAIATTHTCAETAAPQPPSAEETSTVDYDILIIGAGISGIGMAVHLQRQCPNHRFAIIERRADIGGTWDLFRYPGVRSDSDMHTLGYSFAPWRERKAIADGPTILRYLHRIVDEHGLREAIQFQSHVRAADWDSQAACWRVTIAEADKTDESSTASAAGESAPKHREVTVRFLYIGAGYYDYDTPYRADIPKLEDFGGAVIHPQFWSQDYDYTGKRVVVIGSGATAVTIVPAMADKAAHVTLLQRTPTWYFSRSSEDPIAIFLRRILPERLAYALTRFKNIRMQHLTFYLARHRPARIAAKLKQRVADILGAAYNERDFSPPYKPWEQRLCLVPDGDLFHAIADGKASIVTDHIDHIERDGIRLQSGQHLAADVIITATGLQLTMAGKIAISLDGKTVDWHTHFCYKGCMLSNIPNLAFVFGYLNASWTLKADIVATYICQLLNHLRDVGAQVAVPQLSQAEHTALLQAEDDSLFGFSSGYLHRAQAVLPRNSYHHPWRLNQHYLEDKGILTKQPIADNILHFA